jgi:hypothetical protein
MTSRHLRARTSGVCAVTYSGFASSRALVMFHGVHPIRSEKNHMFGHRGHDFIHNDFSALRVNSPK